MTSLIADILDIAKDPFINKHKKYDGTAIEICERVVDACWTGQFFKASEGPRLSQFWIRDFAWSLEGLVYLGHKENIRKTLEWALEKYARWGRVTTTITKRGNAIDISHQSVDALPMLLYSLILTNSQDLIFKYKNFLNKEIGRYYNKVFDPKTKLVRAGILLVEPKDVIHRKQTCVSNCFVIFLSDLLKSAPDLINPFGDQDFRNNFRKMYWNGDYFINDLESGGDFISSDANVWPYWTKVETNSLMLKSSINAIKKDGLDKPFPLKYRKDPKASWAHPFMELLIPNYQGDSIWSLHTPIFIELVSKVYPDEARKYLLTYLDLIKKYGTYIEVFEPDGSAPLKGRLGFGSETGMLWAAAIPRLCDLVLTAPHQ